MIAFLRSFTICLVAFLDDILIIANSRELTEVVISRLRDKEKEVNLEASPDYPDYPVSRFNCNLDKDAPSIVRRKTAKLKSSVLSLLENVPKGGEIFLVSLFRARQLCQLSRWLPRAIQRKLVQVFSPWVIR